MGNKQPTAKKQSLSQEEAWGALDVLPSELVLHILSFADCPTLGKAERVNSLWCDLIRHDNGLWKPRLVALSKHDPLARWETPSSDELWRELEATGKGYKVFTKELVLFQNSIKALLSEAWQQRHIPSYRPDAEAGLPDRWKRFLNDYMPGAGALVGKAKVDKLLIEGKRSRKVLMIGLDAAGKTTMLYYLSPDHNINPLIPTIGFNIETFTQGKLTFVAWDVGGSDKIRSLWDHYLNGTDALIFVVDCHDLTRIDKATKELCWLLRELPGVPLLVYANKIDLPDALSVDDLIKRMGLEQVQDRKWHVQPSCAITRVGIHEGLGWLATHVE